jgi:hypothetical protein
MKRSSFVLKLLVIGSFLCFLFFGLAIKSEARIKSTVDVESLIEESQLICEAEAISVNRRAIFSDPRYQELRSQFRIKKVFKGEVTVQRITVLHIFNLGLNGPRITFEEGKDYILFLKNYKQGLFKLTNDDTESFWLKYKGKARAEKFLPKEKIGRLDLKEQLLYEIAQWLLDPHASDNYKFEMLELFISSGIDSSESNSFLLKYSWFKPVFEKVKDMGGYSADLADTFLKRIKGDTAKIFEGQGKVYVSSVTADIDNVKEKFLLQVKKIFPEIVINVTESIEEDVRIIRIIFKIPEYMKTAERDFHKEVLKGVPYRYILTIGEFEKCDNFELTLKNKGEF